MLDNVYEKPTTEQLVNEYLEALYVPIEFDVDNPFQGITLATLREDINNYFFTWNGPYYADTDSTLSVIIGKYVVVEQPLKPHSDVDFVERLFVHIKPRYNHKYLRFYEKAGPVLKYIFDGKAHEVAKGDEQFYLFKLRLRKFKALIAEDPEKLTDTCEPI